MTESTFEHLQKSYLTGDLTPETFQIKGQITPPEPQDVIDYTVLSQAELTPLVAKGLESIGKQELGALVLAGGMATRFAFDQPKALFPILGERTFLELKIASYKLFDIPIYIMTSFHTHEAIKQFLVEHDYFGYGDHIHLFQQFRLPRMYPDGAKREVDGTIDYATSGHGDFVDAFKQSGLLKQFQDKGGKHLLFSNIDNLGASVDPALLGLYLEHRPQMFVEVAQKYPGDKGGAPARVDERLQIVEGFLFPPEFNQDSIDVFNTATYIFEASVLEQGFDLPWYVVDKEVDGEKVLQFEHLAGDLSRELDILCVKIKRETRFLPVKKQSDAQDIQPFLNDKFGDL